MVFIWDRIAAVWSYLLELVGYRKKTNIILMLGPDNTGKERVVEFMKWGTMYENRPSISTELRIGEKNLTVCLIPRVRKKRTIYPIADADGLVFVIDASDHSYFPKAKDILQSLMTDECVTCPLLILANKTDKAGVVSENEIIQQFELQNHLTGKTHKSEDEVATRPVELFMTSVKRREGVEEGFNWLSRHL